MPNLTAIEAKYSQDIQDAAQRFGDHEDMSPGRVLKWMGQFVKKHLPLARKVLLGTRYYGSANIRAMTRELVISVLQNFPKIDRQRIVFVPVGRPGSSSAIIARVLRELSRTGETRGISVLLMADLEKIPAGRVSVIVFIDDFSATGDQLIEWWENVEQLVRPKRASIFVALLVMNNRTRLRIEEFAELAICVDELDDSANVLSEHSGTFNQVEKKSLLRYCRKTGCSQDFIRGYGSCGLLLAFKHGCPNSSLPILWFDSKAWFPLFKRHAI